MKPTNLFAAGAIAMCLAGPVEAADIVETAQGAGSFNTLVAAVSSSGLYEELKGEGPFTLFAPTDEAFAALPPGTVEALLNPDNKDKLVALLTYHLVPGVLTSKDIVNRMNAETMQGGEIKIALDGRVMINNAYVLEPDILADNGIIHVIDHVMIPYLEGPDS
jgi:uncharacterized surface protein with fasciclin (FAS1) repeats